MAFSKTREIRNDFFSHEGSWTPGWVKGRDRVKLCEEILNSRRKPISTNYTYRTLDFASPRVFGTKCLFAAISSEGSAAGLREETGLDMGMVAKVESQGP